MSPSAITPETTSELVTNDTAHTLAKTVTYRAPNGHSRVPPLPELDAALLQTNYTTSPRPVPALDSPEVTSQRLCTDHMITCSWTVTTGWSGPELKPYGPLSLMPTASVLHYATECFEGMKLYRGHDSALRLFRPQLNAQRMLSSSTRIALPGFAPAELLKLIVKLCATDGPKWLPKDRRGEFLYIRPTMIANDPALGVQNPKEALLYIILACFPSMSDKPGGMRLLASQDDMIRAWPGGFGYAKVGANYGPSLLAQGEARARGYDHILWLFGAECMVTECGASNFFVVWRTREGVVQLVTAPLGDRIILDGVTRRSVLELARERLSGCGCAGQGIEALEVVERPFSMHDIVEAHDEGRLLEAFAAGTALFIAPVSAIHFRGVEFDVPMSEGSSGRYAGLLKGWLKGIMYGKERHAWGYVIREECAVD